MARMPGVAFVPPRSFSKGRPLGPPRWVILHYTAGHEGPNAAEDGAAYDGRRTDGTSAHFHVDSNSAVQCVDTNDRAHTALYHGNAWGIHIEIAGTRQTREQWLDAVSRPTIRKAAEVTAWALQAHGLPLKQLPTNGLANPAARGIADHNACTVSFPDDGGTHTDVGPGFPWDIFLADVAAFLNGEDEIVGATKDIAAIKATVTALWSVVDKGLRGINESSTGPDGVSRPNNWLVRVAGELGADLDKIAADVDTLEESDAQILTLISNVQAGDPAAIAAALLAVLPAATAKATADELHNRTAD